MRAGPSGRGGWMLELQCEGRVVVKEQHHSSAPPPPCGSLRLPPPPHSARAPLASHGYTRPTSIHPPLSHPQRPHSPPLALPPLPPCSPQPPPRHLVLPLALEPQTRHQRQEALARPGLGRRLLRAEGPRPRARRPPRAGHPLLFVAHQAPQSPPDRHPLQHTRRTPRRRGPPREEARRLCAPPIPLALRAADAHGAGPHARRRRGRPRAVPLLQARAVPGERAAAWEEEGDARAVGGGSGGEACHARAPLRRGRLGASFILSPLVTHRSS